MSVTVVVSAELLADKDGMENLRRVACDNGGVLQAVFPGSKDEKLATMFNVRASARAKDVDIAKALQKVDGVVEAYVAPVRRYKR